MNLFDVIDVRSSFLEGDLLWTGHRSSFTSCVRQKRTMGHSQYNFATRLKNFMDQVLVASNRPIRIRLLRGLVTAGLGLLYGPADAMAIGGR